MQVAMKAQQQLTVVFLMISSQLVIACGHPPSSRLCVANINVDIGNFDSVETGARAGVRALSQEIHRCAEAKEYSISWNYPGNEQERGWRALKYIRKDQVSGIIGYEYDPSSGTREPTYLVDDKAVHEVAKEGGTLNDFAKYQKKQSDTHQGFKALGQTGAFASMGSMSIPRRQKKLPET